MKIIDSFYIFQFVFFQRYKICIPAQWQRSSTITAKAEAVVNIHFKAGKVPSHVVLNGVGEQQGASKG